MTSSRAALLAALALACAHRASAPADPGRGPAEYFPLAEGNSWTFLDRSVGQEGGARRRAVRIVGRNAQGYFVDDQHGALRVDGGCLHDQARRLLCGPIRVGASWLSVIGPATTERYQIAGVGEEVTVPAGTFTGCVRVRSQTHAGKLEQVAELTYAPGVGPVRLETFVLVDGVARPQIRGELESYRVEKGR